MKTITISLFALLFTQILLAQDKIILRNGEEIKAKVQEVGLSEIKYKKLDNLGGPVYTVLKSDVFTINYENGTKEVFGSAEDAHTVAPAPKVREERRRSAREPRKNYQQDHKSATKKIVGGAIMTGLGIPVLVGGIGLLTVGATALDVSSSGNAIADGFSVGLIAVGSVLTAGGIVLEVLGSITLSRGIKDRKNGLSMDFAPIRSTALDRYSFAKNQQTICAVRFTF